MSQKTALIIGATGLVGRELMEYLLTSEYYDKVKAVVRRDLDKTHDRLEVIVIPDFDKLDDYKDQLHGNHVYCCLGTTMKQAGSKKNFIKIDLEYPLRLAQITGQYPEFESFHLVTATGANADSPLFYNEVKGKVEEAIIALGLKSLYIYRPSLLLGERKEFRLGEEIAKAISAFISFFVIGSRRGRLWSIKGQDVAKTMYLEAQGSEPGTHILEPKHMVRLGRL